MLFHSPEFVFGFLPITLAGFFLVARLGRELALAWLTLASLVFYGWTNPAWLPVIAGSIAFNYAAGREISSRAWAAARGHPTALSAGLMLAIVVGANLVVLGYFKYAAFFWNSLIAMRVGELSWRGPELPLGISFFTFTQIAFLIDAWRRQAEDRDFVRYGLFVTYYPHLVAGPILHHSEMMPQFARPDVFRFDAGRLADGTVIFVLGLFKKTVLADAFGGYAAPAFAAAATQPVGFFESWSAALSYTLQIYFDFSGYSDMAIGLGLMIGVRLPMNFDSPYKARDIADFWRRWHMTLSRFLREYLYIPLGGNRRGATRQQINLMLTMLLGGLWHGAGWNFVVWGGLHGVYLMAFHAWRRARERVPPRPARWAAAQRPLSWLLTFLAVVIAWVFFRAPDLPSALAIFAGMAGVNGAVLPDQLLAIVPALAHVAQGVGKVPLLADGSVMGAVEMFAMLGAGMAIVLLAPNVAQLRPRWRYALMLPCAALALQRVIYGAPSEFLYFRF